MKPLYLFLLAVVGLVHSLGRAADQPNIIVIIADDLGYADLAFLDHAPDDVKHLGTPGFDRLAATGTYFANAYGASPICSPSRAGLITGRYQQRWGNYWYGEGGLPADEVTLPETLKQAGYRTAKYGKTHLNGGPKEFPTQHGFDEFLGFMHHTWDYIRLSEKDVAAHQAREGFTGDFGCQIQGPLLRASKPDMSQEEATPTSYEDSFTTRIFTDEAVSYIHEADKQQPFYLHVSHNAVHMPTYIVERSWAARTGARYVEWDRTADKWTFPYWDPDTETHQVFHKKWGHMGEIDIEGRRCYLANLLALDHSISRILDALEETDLRRDTLVVFVSDNGGTINTYSDNTPLNGWKYMFGEGGIRIPYLVSMPGTLPEGEIDHEALVSTMDIYPTALELAGIERPQNLDGKSLLPVLNGDHDTHHDHLVWAKNRDSWVIRQGDWKLTNKVGWSHRDFQVAENGDVSEAAETYHYSGDPQLFNLRADIGETTNLIEQHPEKAAELKALYAQWDGQMPGPCTNKGVPKPKRSTTTKTKKLTHPKVVERAFTISATVDIDYHCSGVICAHGGRRSGYALYLEKGVPYFRLNNAEKGQVIKAQTALPYGKSEITLSIAKASWTMKIDGIEVGSSSTGGLLSKQPSEGLSIGYDHIENSPQSIVGEWKDEQHLDGRVRSLKVN